MYFFQQNIEQQHIESLGTHAFAVAVAILNLFAKHHMHIYRQVALEATNYKKKSLNIFEESSL